MRGGGGVGGLKCRVKRGRSRAEVELQGWICWAVLGLNKLQNLSGHRLGLIWTPGPAVPSHRPPTGTGSSRLVLYVSAESVDFMRFLPVSYTCYYTPLTRKIKAN